MSKATMSIEGFMSDPSHGVTRSGDQMLSVSVAHTPRRKNRDTGEFEDAGETLWVRATFYAEMAEMLGTQVSKGMLVRLEGEPTLNRWEKDGEVRVSLELRHASLAIVPRAPRNHGSGASSTVPGASGWAEPPASSTGGFEEPF